MSNISSRHQTRFIYVSCNKSSLFFWPWAYVWAYFWTFGYRGIKYNLYILLPSFYSLIWEIWLCCHSVHLPPSPHFSWEGGLDLLPYLKKGDLAEPHFLEGVCWERGGDFFRGCCNFYIKNKLKSEILKDKKCL